MKKLSCVLVIVFLVCQASAGAKGIQFVKDKSWNAVLALARKENKLIFLDAYTTWCGPCKYMQENVFPLSAVGRFYNARFINVKMDMEQGEGIELMQQFALTAVPTLLFINGDGNVVHRSVGALSAKELVALGKEALGPAR
jgi:thiol:disulfide interchange protein